jgi:cytidylate kinase
MNFITVSEMIGTGGETIARELAQKLNYHFVGDEEVLAAASAMGLILEKRKLEERPFSLMDRIFSERPKVYLDKLQAAIYELAKKGDIVFFGGGAQILLQAFECAFHVFIVGSKEARIKRIMEEKKVDKEVAEKIILASDQNKRSFMRFAFNEDWQNWQLYDLIINTDKLGVSSAVNVIIEGATASEIKACGLHSLRLLEMLSINQRVEAALLEAGMLSPHIFYELDDQNNLRIYGVVYSPKDKEEVEKVLRNLSGINSVKNELRIFPGTAE